MAQPSQTSEETWRDRLQMKLALGGAVGAGAGLVLALRHNRPPLRFATTSTISFCTLMGVFSGVQETARAVSRKDSPANSVLGGAAAGVFLHALDGRNLLLGGAAYGLGAGALHLAADRWEAGAALRRTLQRMDLLDLAEEEERAQEVEAASASRAAEPAESAGAEATGSKILRFMGIHKHTDEEWDALQARKKKARDAQLRELLGDDFDKRH